MQTWWAYYRDPKTGAVIRIEVKAGDPGSARQLMEAQYGAENIIGAPSLG